MSVEVNDEVHWNNFIDAGYGYGSVRAEAASNRHEHADGRDQGNASSGSANHEGKV